jgi:hypothetical protein
MPNAIKYSTTIPTGSLLKGTVALGVTTASISGPTSTTGWYYGPNPVAGKYQIIETAASGDPDVYCPQSDAEVIQFVKSKGATGANTASLSASLAWIGTQTNLMASNFEYENIVTDGLVMNLDAGFVGSYPTTASTWYDISGNNNSGSLTNGPTFNPANSGSIVFDGADDFVSIIETNLTDWSVSAWFKYNYTASNVTIFNLPISSGNKSGTITWTRNIFTDLSTVSFDTTGSIYFGTFGMGVWDSTPRWFGLKLDPTGSLDTTFNINHTVGQAVNQTGFYVGNDGFLYTSGTNLGFFTKNNKQTGAAISSTDAGGASTISAGFIIDESQRKVYHMGSYTTAFGLSRNYICKFDLDTYAVDTVFNTGGGLNSIPNQNQLFLTSDKYLYTVGTFTSYKATGSNHIVRLDQSGSLDPNFKTGAGFSNATNIFCGLDSQNRLVCVGRSFTSYSGSACNGIVRINTNGTRDTTFDIGTGFAGGGVPLKYISIQPDDKVVVSGQFTSYSGSACNGIVRINSDGTRDTTFNIGTGISPLGSFQNYIKSNGEILLGIGTLNTTSSYNGTTFNNFILLNNSGSVVSGFNTGSGFTDTTSRAQFNFRVRNTAGTLTTVSNLSAWPSLGSRVAPITYQTSFNDWVHITYAKDSSNVIRTYTNGVLRNTDTFSTASYQNVDLQINRLVNSNNNAANIFIYNKTLTQAEITQNYNAQKSRFGL